VCSLFIPALGAKVSYVKSATAENSNRTHRGWLYQGRMLCIQIYLIVQVLSVISGNVTNSN
jgi:uncharacterized membrane protein